jgi:hypothetical protein
MGKKPPVYFVFAVLAAAGALALLVVAKESFEAIWDRTLGDETPQQLTASDLLAKGAGANRHVTVTEVAVGLDFLMGSGAGEKENEAYLVVSPAGVAPGSPGKTLIVHVTRFQDYAEARNNPRQQTFTGLFTSDESLPPAQRKLLGEKYPGLALDNIPYLEVRDYKGTSGLWRAFYFGAAGVPLMIAGIAGMLVVARRVKGQSPSKEGVHGRKS